MIAFRLHGRGDAERRLETTARTITIGRAPDQAIVVSDPAVSRHHGEVYVEGNAYWYRDLHSTHGTFECSGTKRTPVDQIRLSEGLCLAIGTPTVTISVERIVIEPDSDHTAMSEVLSEDNAPANEAGQRDLADTLALQALLRLDRRLADAATDSEAAILNALLATLTELFHDAEYVAVLEAVDGTQRILDYALLACGRRIPEIPEAIEHLARSGGAFLFSGGPSAPFEPRDEAERRDAEPDSTSGMCVPFSRGMPLRWVQLERAHETAPFTPRDLDVTTALAARAGDRIVAENAMKKEVL